MKVSRRASSESRWKSGHSGEWFLCSTLIHYCFVCFFVFLVFCNGQVSTKEETQVKKKKEKESSLHRVIFFGPAIKSLATQVTLREVRSLADIVVEPSLGELMKEREKKEEKKCKKKKF